MLAVMALTREVWIPIVAATPMGSPPHEHDQLTSYRKSQPKRYRRFQDFNNSLCRQMADGVSPHREQHACTSMHARIDKSLCAPLAQKLQVRLEADGLPSLYSITMSFSGIRCLELAHAALPNHPRLSTWLVCIENGLYANLR